MISKYLGWAKKVFKNTKVIIVLGITGILLIGFSSVFTYPEKEEKTQEIVYSTEEYKSNLEKQIKNIATKITGDKKVSVLITLESGIKYSYANEKEENKSDKSDGTKSDKSEGVKQSYITVKTENGAEKALVITEHMPIVRGVAVVCNTASQSEINALQNAITASLGVSDKQVFVTAKAR